MFEFNGQNYSSDDPISDKKKDLFNRTKFVDDVIEAFNKLEKDNCYTIGLYARWGSGKTSTINLISQKLENNEKFSVIYIDAWEHNGRTIDIQYEIADQIINREKGKDTLKKKKHWIRKVLKNTPDEFTIEGVPIPVAKIGNAIMSAYDNRVIRNTLEDRIKKSEKQYIVFIDNIDRLDSAAILGVLHLINQLANYGGVVYLLPFDKDYVCRSIEDKLPNKISGEEYMEKIINLPLNLPSIPQDDIDNIFFKSLNEVLKNERIDISEEDMERFRVTYFFHGVNKYLKTPRDIKRILNSLIFILPSKKNNTNIVDLILMEMLRIFDPHFYDDIYNSKLLLISGGSIFTSRYDFNDQDKSKEIEDLNLLTKEDRQKQKVLAQLFPYVKTLLWNNEREDADELRKNKRIASERYFDIYFSPVNDLTNISDENMTKILENSNSKEDIDRILSKIVKPGNCNAFLRKVSDNAKMILNKTAFCESLLDLAGDIYERHAAFTLSLSSNILFTIDEILKDSTTKMSDYEQLLEYNYKCGRFQTIPFLIRQVIIYSEKDRAIDGVPILKQDEVKEYKKFALSIIRGMADKDVIPLDATDESTFIYHYWSDFAGKSEVSKYVKKHISTAEQAIDFISQFLGVWSVAGSNDYKRGDLDAATIKQIDRYVETSYLYNIVVSDNVYGCLSNDKEESIESFEEPFRRGENSHISRLGNEHTEEFRKIVSKRFIYYYNQNKEQKIKDNKTK